MSHKVAFIFPGQGSQYVGMGKEFYEGFEYAREVFDIASEVLDIDMKRLCFEGPADALNKTENTQPAILTVSISALNVLNKYDIKADVVAGHSLGEYTAAVAVGSIGIRDAIMLVRKRGQFMQEAVPEGQGMMVAILGLDKKIVEEMIDTGGMVTVANYNCPGQIVIAGDKKTVEEVVKVARGSGAKKVVPLSVSIPSHTPLMGKAAERLEAIIDDIDMDDPHIPLVCNISAKFVDSKEELKISLIQQLTNPVLWEDSVKVMIDAGVDTFIEVGPGNVLSGLVRRTDKGVRTLNVGGLQNLEETLKELTVGS
ncbi:MAG: ACP S-malonyltransferase [Nitrospirota bacterium]